MSNTRRGASACRRSRPWRWRTEDSPVYVAGGVVVLASMYLDKDKLVAAMRGNGALFRGPITIPASFSGTERFFRPGYRAQPGEQLAAGSGRCRADGSRRARRWPTSDAAMALRPSSWRRPFPTSTFQGFDFHEPFH